MGIGVGTIDFELWERKGNLGGGPVMLTSLPLDVMVVECELASVDSSSSWTSSREDVDSRRAVSSGDLDPFPSDVEWLASLPISTARSNLAGSVGGPGVDDRREACDSTIPAVPSEAV